MTDPTVSAPRMMEHTLVYAHVQSALLTWVPADVRAYSAYLMHALFNVVSSLLVLLFSPVLYLLEKVHRRGVRPPSRYAHVLLTGASSGAGEGLCYAHAKPGTRLVLVARDEEQLQLVARKCRELGADAHIELCDVRDEQGMQSIVDRAEQVAPLDLVLAVAGHEAAMSRREDIVSASRELVQINFLGMLNTILPAVPYMRKRKRGQLVLFSSQLGFIAAPLATDYDSCKVGIRLYGEGLRSLLWRDNVAVNVIVPGGMITPMMNTLTERAHAPTVGFMLPVPNAVRFMTEGLARNEPVIAFPSVMTAFNSALGAWPAPLRSMMLTLATSAHHVAWRMGEVAEYQPRDWTQAQAQAQAQPQSQPQPQSGASESPASPQAPQQLPSHGFGKADDFYAKERKAETCRQRQGGMSSLDQ